MSPDRLAAALKILLLAEHNVGEIGSDEWDALAGFVKRNRDALLKALADAQRYQALHEAVARDEIVTLWHDEFGWVARHITADETYQYSRPDLRASVDAMIASLAAKEIP